MSSAQQHPAGATSRRHRPIQLILDFDGTLTTRDTLSSLAGVEYKHRPSLDPTLRPWRSIVDAYLRDLERHNGTFHRQTRGPDDSSLAREIAYHRSLRAVEDASVSRVVAAGVFDGVGRGEVETAAEDAVRDGNVVMRAGWLGLVAGLRKHNLRICGVEERGVGAACAGLSVVSVNWSRWWVWCCLRSAAGVQCAGGEGDAEAVDAVLRDLEVCADELTAADAGGHEGRESAMPRGEKVGLRTSEDKVSQMRRCQHSFCEAMRDACGGVVEEPMTVYVGDSATDIECLLAADVGVVVRDEVMRSGQMELAGLCERAGIGVRSISGLDCADVVKTGKIERRTELFSARTFCEVEQELMRLRNLIYHEAP